jgi:hypothetical protein
LNQSKIQYDQFDYNLNKKLNLNSKDYKYHLDINKDFIDSNQKLKFLLEKDYVIGCAISPISFYYNIASVYLLCKYDKFYKVLFSCNMRLSDHIGFAEIEERECELIDSLLKNFIFLYRILTISKSDLVTYLSIKSREDELL